MKGLSKYYSLLNSGILGPTGSISKGEIRILRQDELHDMPNAYIERIGVKAETDRYMLVEDPVEFSNGKIGTYFRFLTKSALNRNIGSAVLPVLPNGDFMLNVIYRHATRMDEISSWRLEVPRGCGDSGESSVYTALREIQEEQGFIANKIQHLGYCDPDSGMTSGRVAMYVACISEDGKTKAHRDDGESGMGVVRIPRLDFVKMMTVGELRLSNKLVYLRDGYLLSTFAHLLARESISS